MTRPRFESAVADELSQRFATLNIAGYPSFIPSQGWLQFTLVDNTVNTNDSNVTQAIAKLVFARQAWWIETAVALDDPKDRVQPILDACRELRWHRVADDIMVECPDSDASQSLARFTRKFTVPLRQSLRRIDIVTPKGSVPKDNGHDSKAKCLHIFMPNFEQAFVGRGVQGVSSKYNGGINRLKFPTDAPSRSTLKLEEAILDMLTADQQASVFKPNSQAVDLGACPGGWTYQLVKRGMRVEAVDNGDIDEKLMSTGQVSHYQADGFTYQPQKGKVQLLVCDMIEKPDRVAVLMASWLQKGWAEHAIFNLKLPMKRKFETVQTCLEKIKGILRESQSKFEINAKHLYHNRDEVTVSIVRHAN